MDNKKEEAGRQVEMFAPVVHRYTSTCASCDNIDTTYECVKCLRLHCEKCIAVTPRGMSCGDCYPALHPESLFADMQNLLTKIH